MNVILQFWIMSSQIMSNRLLYQNICQCFKILRIRSILLISDFFLGEKLILFAANMMYVGCKNDIFRNDLHISIIKLTSTKSWNKSFSFLQALANPAAFSEHQTTVSRKRLMPLNDVYFNMDNIPLFSKFRLLTFMQSNVSKSADLTLTRLFQFVFRFVQFCCLVYSLNATSTRFNII